MSGRYMQQNQHNQQNKRRRHDESSVYSSNSHSMSRNIPSIKSTRGSNYQNSSTKIGELRLEGSDSLYLDLSTLPSSSLHKYMSTHHLAEHLPPPPKRSNGSAILPFALKPSQSRQSNQEINNEENQNDPNHNVQNGLNDNYQPSLEIQQSTRPRRPSRNSPIKNYNEQDDDDDDDMLDPDDMEEEAILPDIDDAHTLFNKIVSQHYREQPVREVDCVVNFVYALRSKERALKVLPID